MKIIYKIVNKNSKKIYIGSSSEFEFRKVQHLSLLKRNKHHSIHLQRSFNKWGADSFSFEILESFTEGNILEREQYYLDTLLKASEPNLYFIKNSYNIARVAGSSTKCKCVYKYSLNGEYLEMFNSCKEAGAAHNITGQTIQAACKSSTRTGAGFQWRYKDAFFAVKNLDTQYQALDKDNNVIQVYDSLQDIKVKTGLKTKSNIIRAVNNNLTCIGYYWKVISRPV